MAFAPLQKAWIMSIHAQWLEERLSMRLREVAQGDEIDDKLFSIALPADFLMQNLQCFVQDREKPREIPQVTTSTQSFPFRNANKDGICDKKIKNTFDHHA